MPAASRTEETRPRAFYALVRSRCSAVTALPSVLRLPRTRQEAPGGQLVEFLFDGELLDATFVVDAVHRCDSTVAGTSSPTWTLRLRPLWRASGGARRS